MTQNLPTSDLCTRIDVPDAGVWAVHYQAQAEQAEGRDVVLMSVGDPDFPTPDGIVDALVASIRGGRTHYAPAGGEDELRAAIAELESKNTGLKFTKDQFVILPGATGCLHAVLSCICNAGDEVIIPEPMYIGYRAMIDAIGIRVSSVSLDLANECVLDADAVLDAVNDATKAVIINTPGNPCGNIVPAEQLAYLARELLERNVWLVCDEVYSLFTFDEPHISLLKCADKLDNVIVIDGLSKSHAMTGWRIGWVCSPPDMTRALSAYSGAAYFGCSQFIQDAAAYAIRHDGPHVDQMCEAYRERRDLVLTRLEAMPALRVLRPKAGMFVMIDVSRVSQDGEHFAQDLLAQEGVSVIPGRGFGDNAASFVRLSLTHSVDVIADAMNRIERYVAG